MNKSPETKEGMEDFVKRHCTRVRRTAREAGFDKLDTLSSREREILELRMEGLTLEEIGIKLGMPRPNVYRTQKRALEKMKRRKIDEELMW